MIDINAIYKNALDINTLDINVIDINVIDINAIDINVIDANICIPRRLQYISLVARYGQRVLLRSLNP